MIKDKELDKFLKANFNVLFSGKHGTGKTSVVLDTFARNGLKFAYFSAATMDPWTDLIGIPKENGGHIDYIRPRNLDDQLEAIFIDEFNRAPSKVTNALMELIQFKTINGRKFPKLRVIWAAINPDDDEVEYSVNKMDDAHRDRFQIQIKCDDKPDVAYFVKRFGADGEKAAKLLIEKYADLKKSKAYISPRRLEQAIIAFQQLGTTKFTINTMLGSSTFAEMLDNLLKSEDRLVTLREYMKLPTQDRFLAAIRQKAYEEAWHALLTQESTDSFKHIMSQIGDEQIRILKRKTNLVNSLGTEKLAVINSLLPAVTTIDCTKVDVDNAN